MTCLHRAGTRYLSPTLLLLLFLAAVSEGCCPPCHCPAREVCPPVPERQPVADEPTRGPAPELPPLPTAVDEPEELFDPDVDEPLEVAEGVVAPYLLDNLFRGFGKCRRGKRKHAALDFGGVGPHSGLGTPVVSMNRARVTFIGLCSEDPKKFGRLDKRSGTVTRGRRKLPRSMRVKGYGRVYFFTRNYGSWRSGNVLVTEGLDGPLEGHVIRYMHLGAIHPDLRVNDIVEAGQEIGLMGGTAVQDSSPHVHIDITDPAGNRLDVEALLGLREPHPPCP